MEPTRGKVDLSSIGIDTAKLNDAKVSVNWKGRFVTIEDTKGKSHKLTMEQFVKVVDNNVNALVQIASFSTKGSAEQTKLLAKAKSLIQQAKVLDHKATEASLTGLKSYRNEFEKIEEERIPSVSSDFQNIARSQLNQINQYTNDQNSKMSNKERLAYVNTLINDYNETIKDWKDMWKNDYADAKNTDEAKFYNFYSPLMTLDALPGTEQKIDNVAKQTPLFSFSVVNNTSSPLNVIPRSAKEHTEKASELRTLAMKANFQIKEGGLSENELGALKLERDQYITAFKQAKKDWEKAFPEDYIKTTTKFAPEMFKDIETLY